MALSGMKVQCLSTCRSQERIYGLPLGLIVQVCVARRDSQSFMAREFLDGYEIYLSHGKASNKIYGDYRATDNQSGLPVRARQPTKGVAQYRKTTSLPFACGT